jgi:hypothetical protein
MVPYVILLKQNAVFSSCMMYALGPYHILVTATYIFVTVMLANPTYAELFK